MRITFAVAAMLIAGALAVAVGTRWRGLPGRAPRAP